MARILKKFTTEATQHPRDFLILLSSILAGQLRMTFTQPFSLYMLSHIEVDQSSL
jgi:hypothetical protein